MKECIAITPSKTNKNSKNIEIYKTIWEPLLACVYNEILVQKQMKYQWSVSETNGDSEVKQEDGFKKILQVVK